MQPSLYLHTPEDWGLRTEEIEDMDKLLMLTMVDFRSSSSWSSLLLTSRRKHGTSSWTWWMLLHTKLAVLDYYFSTQRKFFHQMNSALALGCLRLSELSSIPSHVMGMLLVIELHMRTYCTSFHSNSTTFWERTEYHCVVAARQE